MNTQRMRRWLVCARSVLGALVLSVMTACGGGGDDSPTAPVPPPPAAPTVGTITGRVTAASTGAALDGAAVSTSPASGTATTDALGNYSIAGVPVGTYTVTAAKSGYTSSSATVTVSGGQTSTANISMPLAAPVYSYSQVAVIQGPNGGVASIALSPDGATIAYGNYDDNLIRIVDVATRQQTRTLTGHTNRVTDLAFSADSRFLASTGTVNLPPIIDGSVRLWELSTGNQRALVNTPGTSDLRFAPNGGALVGASGGDPVSIRVWDPSTLALTRTISGVFRFAAFSPDGRSIASGGRNDLLTVLDFASGTQQATHTGHTGWVTAAAYSANGQLLASAGEDRVIRIRNAQTGATTQTLAGHGSYPDFLAFSPDGTVLASGGSGVNVIRSGGGIIVTLINADRFIRLWNLATGIELARVNIDSDVLSGAALSADWRTLVTGSNAGAIRIFRRAQ